MIAAAPGRPEIDAVDWHPYVGDVSAIMQSLKRARATLAHSGLAGVPIEVSEVGWNGAIFGSVGRNLALRSLASQLPAAGLGVERLMPYVWSGAPDFQLADRSGVTGSGVAAYLAGIRAATSAVPAAAPVTGATKRCDSKRKRAAKASVALSQPPRARDGATRRRAAARTVSRRACRTSRSGSAAAPRTSDPGTRRARASMRPAAAPAA